MAKSSKSKTSKSKIESAASDAVEVDAVVVAGDAGVSADEVIEASVESDTVDDVPDDEDGLDLASGDDHSDLDMEVIEDPVQPLVENLPEPVVEEKSSGFVPMLAGGVIAAALGYGAATVFPIWNGSSDDTAAALAEQSAQIAALEDQIANIPAPDLSAVQSRIDDLTERTGDQIDNVAQSLSEQISNFDGRLTELEKQPNADGTLSDTALAAYQDELDALRAELTAQQGSVMSAAAQAEADLAAARAEAEALEKEALAAAEAAAARAALNRVATAVETGAPFASALSDLDAASLPNALTAAAEAGVATTAQLTEDFPAAARAALATARSEGVSDDAGGIGGFLRSQFDVRSTTPQEGAGPDAVLSRAEAAVKEGRISDALAELEALPEVARAELTDWTARATERADVLNAIATLSETYN